MAKNKHAVILGRKGGKVKSQRKTLAVRENGKKGGRPRKASMTSDEFEARYARRSNLTIDQLRAAGRVVVACDCREDGCCGWVSITNQTTDEQDQERVLALKKMARFS